MTHDVDVLVVGAGPAGLAAAVHAAEAGARASSGLRVALVDQQPSRGGQIWRPDLGQAARAARPWLERAQAAGVRWLPGLSIVDALDATTLIATPIHSASIHGTPIHAAASPLRLQAQRLILATGAQERYLPFPGSTHPRVTAVGGLQALVKGGLDVSGQRILIAGSGPLLLAVADSLRRRGARIVAIVEQASRKRLARFALSLIRYPAKLVQLAGLQARLLGIPRRYGSWPTGVEDASDSSAAPLRVSIGGSESQNSANYNVDRVATGFGLLPEVRLASLLGCRLRDSGARSVWVDAEQRTSVPEVFCAGESTGIGGVDKALLEGEIAGRHAAADLLGHAERLPAGLYRRRDRARGFASELEHAFRLRPELRHMTTPASVVCRCEDVTWEQLRDLDDPRAAKLLTRCGMGACQGRLCAGAFSFLHGSSSTNPHGAMCNRDRPPLHPITLGQLAEAWSHTSPAETPP